MRALSVGDQDAAIQRLFPAFRLTCPFDFMGKWRGPLRPLARTYEIGIAYALAEFRRMIALDRNFAQGHTATGLGLMYAGEPARALEPFAIASVLILTIRTSCGTSWRRRISAWENMRSRPSSCSIASHAILAPTRAACCWHLVTAISGARNTRGQYGLSFLKVNPDFSLMQRARVLPYKNPDDFQRIREGLAKAGLP
jgi:adenylate cyclase